MHGLTPVPPAWECLVKGGESRAQSARWTMAKGAEHAKKDHGMTTIPPDLAKKVEAAIKDK
jgi:predicted small metal-binding protein